VRVLVTGGAGYVGSHACKRLAQAGHAPVTFDDLSEGHKEAVRWGPLVEGDLADTKRVAATLREERIEAVLHFAANAYVGESMREPRKYFRNNVAGTVSLLDAMAEAGVTRLVFSSTCATYGLPDKLPLTEDSPTRPVNPYGESKLFVEKMLRWCHESYGLQWAALRYFIAAGADPEGDLFEDHHVETHLIPLAIDAALGRRAALDVFGTDYPTPDGTAIRDYVHVSDLADAHVAALEHLRAGGAPLVANLGTGRGHSVKEVVAAVERVSGRKVPVRHAPRRPGDPPELVADPSYARRALGWSAKRADLDVIVRDAWKAREARKP